MTDFDYAPFIECLQELYQREGELNRPAPGAEFGNPCGDCNACCRRPIRLAICAIERKFLQSKLSKEDYEAFLRFVSGKNGGTTCPLYDPALPGCRAYEIRPLCCRFFGAFKQDQLPPSCVYRTSPPEEKKAAMGKISGDALALRRNFFQKQGRDFTPASEMDFIFLGTVLFDRGDFSQALQVFQDFLVQVATNDYALAMVEEIRKILGLFGS